jgi:hypothetical protein
VSLVAAVSIVLSVLAAAVVLGGFVWAARADGRDQDAQDRKPARSPLRRR